MIATAMNKRIKPVMVSGRNNPLRSIIYSGAGIKIWIIRSNSSERIISPREKRIVKPAVEEEIGLSRSLFNTGSCL